MIQRDHDTALAVPEWPAEEERCSYVRALIMETAPPPARLVELGAAPGVQSLSLARAGYVVTAVDLGEASDAWGQQPEGTMERVFSQEGIYFVRWDLEQDPYPLEDSSFDVVVLTEVLEHRRDYPLRALKEVHRILCPGGVLLLTTPNAASPRNRTKLALGRSVYTPLADWMTGLPHARHAREYTVGELCELVERAGLEVVRIEGRHFHIRSGRQSRAAVAVKLAIDRLGRRKPSLGANLALVARR